MKITTSLIALLFSIVSYSQSLICEDGNSIVIVEEPTTINIDLRLNLQNQSDSDKNFHVSRNIIQDIQGTTNFFNWGFMCYAPHTDESAVPQQIDANATDNSFFLVSSHKRT